MARWLPPCTGGALLAGATDDGVPAVPDGARRTVDNRPELGVSAHPLPPRVCPELQVDGVSVVQVTLVRLQLRPVVCHAVTAYGGFLRLDDEDVVLPG